LAYLQRALNISFAPEEIAAAAGTRPPSQPVDLDGLELIRKQLYDTRTRENTLAKQADATVQRLSGALAEDEATDWVAEAKLLQIARDAAMQALNGRIAQLAADANEQRRKYDADFDAQIAAIEKERARVHTEIDKLEKAETAKAQLDARIVLDKLTGDLARAQERARKAAQNRVFRAEIDKAQVEAAEHRNSSADLTRRLEAIDALKRAKLDSLPIAGVELRDGQFYVDGLPFDDLNTGEQYLRAFQVGALQPGELGIMIADRGETLSEENFKAFEQAAIASGFQVFITRVSAGPLDVQVTA
jgi:hypothetical protein